MDITEFPRPPGAADEARTAPAPQEPPKSAPNAKVFDDYDMVVTVPRRVINAHLARLQASGAIASRLILAQQQDAAGNYTYRALQSSDQIPRDADGNPTVPALDVAIRPRIDIPASGQRVTLVLEFLSGDAWLRGGAGPLAGAPTRYDATGWTYGVAVPLVLAAVGGDWKRPALPPAVQQQLGEFVDDTIRMDRLFLDLEAADLPTPDPATTSLGAAGKDAARDFGFFMQFYLDGVSRSGNPFVLGYTATATDQTLVPAGRDVPDLLRPTGATFTLYHDPADPDLSTVNYVLVTRGGHGTIPGTPANFTSNWFSPGERCDAKVIYSHRCLAEPLLVKPVFDQVREKVYQQISQNVKVGKGNHFGAARQPTAKGWHFDISSVTDGHDQYTNAFDVACSGPRLSFTGKVHVYKKVSHDEVVCTAHASAWGDARWGGAVTLAAAGGALTASGSFATTSTSSDSDQNSCAKTFDWIGGVLGGVLDVFTGWAHGGLFSNLFASAFSATTHGGGDLNAVLGNLSSSAAGVVVLPAGGGFDIARPAIDAAGNVSLELTCRQ